MSVTREYIYAPQPQTTRATPTQLSVDPKGERIAYTAGKSVFLRSIDDPSLSTQYVKHTANVNVARFSPSGYYIASGDASGMVHVWDCAGADMSTKGEFPIVSGPIKDVAWDGESKRLIAVGHGKQAFGRAITFDTGNSVGEISGHMREINSVSIRAQRPYRAVTGSDDHTMVFYHGTPFKYNTSLRQLHSNFVQGVAFSPDGEWFVSVASDRKIFLFDGKTGEMKKEVGEGVHKGGVLSVSWAPDSKKFVTASADQTVKIWDVETRENVKSWRFGAEGVTSIPDQQVGVVWTGRKDGLIISLSLSGDLNYLSEDADAPKRVVSGHQSKITALELVDNSTLFTGSHEGRVCRWDLAKGLADYVQGPGHSSMITGFALTPSGGITSTGWDDQLRSIDSGAGLFLENPLGLPSQPKGIATCNKSHTIVLTVDEVLIYDTSSPPSLVASQKLSYTPTALSASPVASEFAVGNQNPAVHIYTFSGSTITEKAVLKENLAAPASLSYSHSGAYLAAGESMGKITLFAADKAYEVVTKRWSFHTARVLSIAWNTADTHVVTGSLDTDVYVYSVEKPMRKAVAKNAHMEGVNAVTWIGAEGVLSAGADGAVKRWKVVLP